MGICKNYNGSGVMPEMTTYTIKNLHGAPMEPCTKCKGDMSKGLKRVMVYTCPHCSGTGFEPVAVENPVFATIEKTWGKMYSYELQVGIPVVIDIPNTHRKALGFEIKKCNHYCSDCDGSKNADGNMECCKCKNKQLKFIPIRPQVEGDLSVLMVVKTNG